MPHCIKKKNYEEKQTLIKNVCMDLNTLKKQTREFSENNRRESIYLILDLIKEYSNIFESHNIPININLQFQEDNPEVEHYKEFYYSSVRNTYLNQEIRQ